MKFRNGMRTVAANVTLTAPPALASMSMTSKSWKRSCSQARPQRPSVVAALVRVQQRAQVKPRPEQAAPGAAATHPLAPVARRG